MSNNLYSQEDTIDKMYIIPKIGGLRGGVVEREWLLKQDSIYITLDTLDGNQSCSIYSNLFLTSSTQIDSVGKMTGYKFDIMLYSNIMHQNLYVESNLFSQRVRELLNDQNFGLFVCFTPIF